MSNIVVHVPVNLKTWGGRKVIVGPNGKDLRQFENSIRRDEKLINTIAKSYRWQRQMAAGISATDISKAEGISSKSYVLRMVRMMFLSPKIIDDILNGNQPSEFSLSHIEKTFSPIWREQSKCFSFNSK